MLSPYQDIYSKNEITIDLLSFAGSSALFIKDIASGIGYLSLASLNSYSISVLTTLCKEKNASSFIRLCVVISALAFSALAFPTLISFLGIHQFVCLSFGSALKMSIVHFGVKASLYALFKAYLYFNEHSVKQPSSPLTNFPKFDEQWTPLQLRTLHAKDTSQFDASTKNAIATLFFRYDFPPQGRVYSPDEMPNIDYKSLGKNISFEKLQWIHLTAKLKPDYVLFEPIAQKLFANHLPPPRSKDWFDVALPTKVNEIKTLSKAQIEWVDHYLKAQPEKWKALPFPVQTEFNKRFQSPKPITSTKQTYAIFTLPDVKFYKKIPLTKTLLGTTLTTGFLASAYLYTQHFVENATVFNNLYPLIKLPPPIEETFGASTSNPPQFSEVFREIKKNISIPFLFDWIQKTKLPTKAFAPPATLLIAPPPEIPSTLPFTSIQLSLTAIGLFGVAMIVSHLWKQKTKQVEPRPHPRVSKLPIEKQTRPKEIKKKKEPPPVLENYQKQEDFTKSQLEIFNDFSQVNNSYIEPEWQTVMNRLEDSKTFSVSDVIQLGQVLENEHYKLFPNFLTEINPELNDPHKFRQVFNKTTEGGGNIVFIPIPLEKGRVVLLIVEKQKWSYYDPSGGSFQEENGCINGLNKSLKTLLAPVVQIYLKRDNNVAQSNNKIDSGLAVCHYMLQREVSSHEEICKMNLSNESIREKFRQYFNPTTDQAINEKFKHFKKTSSRSRDSAQVLNENIMPYTNNGTLNVDALFKQMDKDLKRTTFTFNDKTLKDLEITTSEKLFDLLRNITKKSDEEILKIMNFFLNQGTLSPIMEKIKNDLHLEGVDCSLAFSGNTSKTLEEYIRRKSKENPKIPNEIRKHELHEKDGEFTIRIRGFFEIVTSRDKTPCAVIEATIEFNSKTGKVTEAWKVLENLFDKKDLKI